VKSKTLFTTFVAAPPSFYAGRDESESVGIVYKVDKPPTPTPFTFDPLTRPKCSATSTTKSEIEFFFLTAR
jgi:hypothetical protein